MTQRLSMVHETGQSVIAFEELQLRRKSAESCLPPNKP